MADFAITITNQINCFGLNPSSKWGSGQMTWGVTKWGEGTNPQVFEVEKVLAESQEMTSTVSTVMDFVQSFSESIGSSFEIGSGTLQDPAGFYYVFTLPSTDAENQVITSYSAQSRQTTTYSESNPTSTTWS